MVRKLLATSGFAIAAVMCAASANATAFVNDFYLIPADAAHFTLDYGTSTSDVAGATFKNTFINAPAGSTFNDSYHFTLERNGTGSGSVSTSFSSTFNSLRITDLIFNNQSYAGSLVQNASGTSVSIGDLPIFDSIPNTLTLVGTVVGSGSYTGTATFTAAAVPEPATWGMMVVGFGLLGAAARRSRKVSTNVSFS